MGSTSAATSLTTSTQLALRLRHQLITATPAAPASPSKPATTASLAPQRTTVQTTPTDVVRHLLAMQAQDFEHALWAVALRTAAAPGGPTASRASVLSALASGEVVRAAPLRGTLHFVTSDDLRWITALTAERTLAQTATRTRQLGLDESILRRAADIAEAALSGGGAMQRSEFFALLEGAGISPAGQRGYHVIFHLCQIGLLCWGPPKGTQQALVLVDEWIPATRDRDRDEALGELVTRYIAGHGPATVADVAWWSKLTLTDIRRGIEVAGGALESRGSRKSDDAELWLTAGVTEAVARPSGVHLLPGFDEYLLGYTDRTLALEAEFAQRVVPGNNGMFMPMVVSRGRIVGTWRRPAKQGGAVTAEPFTSFTAAEQSGIDRESARFARYAQPSS